MIKEFKIAKSVIDNYVEERDSFSLSELKKEIQAQGGAMRISPSKSIEDYLYAYILSGKISYNSLEDRYNRFSSLF